MLIHQVRLTTVVVADRNIQITIRIQIGHQQGLGEVAAAAETAHIGGRSATINSARIAIKRASTIVEINRILFVLVIRLIIIANDNIQRAIGVDVGQHNCSVEVVANAVAGTNTANDAEITINCGRRAIGKIAQAIVNVHSVDLIFIRNRNIKLVVVINIANTQAARFVASTTKTTHIRQQCGAIERTSIKSAHAIVQINHIGLIIIACHNVKIAVGIEIGQTHRLGRGGGCAKRLHTADPIEIARAVIAVDHTRLAVVARHKVIIAIAIHITNRQRPRFTTDRPEAAAFGKCRVAVEIHHILAGVVGRNNVQITIIVEIAHRHRIRIIQPVAKQGAGAFAEIAASIIKIHHILAGLDVGCVGLALVAQHNIEVAISVHVARHHAASRPNAKLAARTEQQCCRFDGGLDGRKWHNRGYQNEQHQTCGNAARNASTVWTIRTINHEKLPR